MGSRHERGLVEDALDSGVGALAGGATGAVGHGDEIGAQWRQPRDRFPQRLLHLLGLGRKKLEGDADTPLAAVRSEERRVGKECRASWCTSGKKNRYMQN